MLGSLAAPAAASAPASAAAASTYSAQGQVESIEPDGLVISHGAIAALKWPPMTMGFRKPEPRAFAEVRPGDRVHFEFRRDDDDYVLVSVHRLGVAQ